jgi:hypothetical protein
MKRFIMITALCAFASVVACDKSSDPKPDEPVAKNGTTGASAPAPTPAAPVAVTIDDGDLSTPADFEEAAEKGIDSKNYKAELTTLEADLSKD